MAKRSITAEDLFQLRIASDPQVSPDGKRILLSLKITDVEKNQYCSHLWIVDAESGVPRQYTFGEVSDSGARWSPDGQRIAFIRAKEKRSQVWLIRSDGGEACPLTALPEGTLGNLCWSPDGRRLAFTHRPTDPQWTQDAQKEREQHHRSPPPRVITRLLYREDGAGFFGQSRQHVWVCPVPDSFPEETAQPQSPQQVTDGDYDDSRPVWVPGSRLAFISNRGDDPEEKPYQEDIWIVSAEGGPLTKVPAPVGYKSVLVCSPDGQRLAFFMEEGEDDPWAPRNAQLWVVDLEKGDARSLTASLDRTAGNCTLSDIRAAFAGGSPPVWSEDGRHLYFLVSDSGNVHLYGVDAETRSGRGPLRLTEGAIDISGFDVKAARFAVLASQPARPATLQMIESPTAPAPPRLLWDPNRLLIDEVQLSEPEEFWLPNGGEQTQAWLLRPPDFDAAQKYPLVLYIHGGPHAQYGNTFFHEFQFLAARGYLVLYANPRGSMGYPESFAAAIRGQWGELDHQDLMAVVDHACRLPYVDTARLAVAGGSYGGYMTNWIVGHTDRFRCAITDRSVVNLHSMAGTSDFPFHVDGYWKGNWWDRPEELWRQSPLKYVAGCRTPLLIIHSEGDLRCPISQVEELYSALKRLKRKVVFVRYPAETSHGLSRGGPPDLRLDRLQRIANWLDEHLKGQ